MALSRGLSGMTTTTTTTRVLLATVAGALAFLVAGVGGATAAPAASLKPTSHCWNDVVNDWLKHQPNVTGTYAIPCYTQAIQHLNAYPDLRGYSSAIDDIRKAQLAAIRRGNGGGPRKGGGPLGGPGPGNSGPPQAPRSTSSHNPSLWQRITDRLAPGNAQSIPLPLIVLAGLALLLLLAAGGTWFARRIQTRRLRPAPAPAPTHRR
jgi:hypothetical protein